MRNLFGSGKGLWQLGYDFASLEARIMGHYVIPYTEGKELATALVAEKPNDIHSINARKLGIERSAAKSFSYAAIYGAQPKKLAKMLGITENEGKKLFNDYWDAVPALKELKERVEKVWEKSGKKHIPGLDGRLLNTRSKHSLINVLFQSGGAIAAKWSAVRLAQAMEREDILGDPFVHTLKDTKIWWLIHMHDEQQMAGASSLFDVKVFKTDDEAKAAMIPGCSALGHGSKGPYIAYKTKPIYCIEEGIASACRELDLRVDLGFEYIVGKSWGQCH
jgi:DNA polymerase I-like protein with 3'-5' exonuclease and polymerase domains